MRIRGAMLCGAIVLMTAAPIFGQSSIRDRDSLVINEIMPDISGGRCPWIELHNPTEDILDLSRFSLRIGGSPSFQVASSPTPIMPGDYFVACFQIGSCTGCAPSPSPRENPITIPESSAERLAPIVNDAVLEFEPDVGHGPSTVPVDYVAWGAPGASWSQSLRSSLWPDDAFVGIEGHFATSGDQTLLAQGGSIGRYPGSSVSRAIDWAVYDADEIRDRHSRGSDNPVPRPKGLSKRSGSTVARQSVAFSWLRQRSNETYQLRVTRVPSPGDPEPPELVIDRTLAANIVRIGEILPEARYLFSLQTKLGDTWSIESVPLILDLTATVCDWPLPPRFTPYTPYGDPVYWYADPVCGTLPICNRIESMKFSFQRKDTYLDCTKCPSSSDPAGRCGGGVPHAHCESVAYSGTGEAPSLCSGPVSSSTCSRLSTTKLLNAGLSVPLGLVPFLSSPLVWGIGDHVCEHGSEYCAMASISMVASAYGACLSQDRVAYHLCEREADHKCEDLRHKFGVMAPHLTETIKWALWIPDELMALDPPITPPTNQPDFVAAQFSPTNPAIVQFSTIKRWIDQERPIIALAGGHYTVVAGYCQDFASAEHQWLFVFDPLEGPIAEPFADWQAATVLQPVDDDGNPLSSAAPRGIWVAPPRDGWSGVEIDESTVWSDADGDGSRDMNESRFGTDPNLLN